jgi:tetratricopeptide (TPR) repeat protein
MSLARRRLQSAVLLACGLAVAPLLGCQSQEAKLAEHQSRGEAYAKDGKYPEAIIEFKNVLQIDPNRADGHYQLAKAYLAQNDLPKGFWELRETARLDPSNYEAKLQYGQLARLAGELDEALKQADDVIAAQPDKAAAHVLRGQALERLKRPDEADASFKRGMELDQTDTAPTFLYADFLVRNGKPDDAEPLFRKLTEIKPEFPTYVALASFLARDPKRDAETETIFQEALAKAKPDQLSTAYRTLASFYYTRERYGDAEKTLREAIEKTPDDLETIYALARFYVARGNDKKADEMVLQATAAKPDDEKTWLVLSAFRSRQGDLPGALAAAEDAIKRNPDSKTAKLRKAELLLDMGYREGSKEKIAEGRSITDAVLAKEPGNSDALFVKAKIDLAESRNEDAITALRRALETKPDWAQAHFLLGSALFLQNDRNGARAEVARAVEIEPDLLEARKLLARIQASLGQFDLAAEEGRKFLDAKPKDADARLQLAQALVRLGKPQDALVELDKIDVPDRNAEIYYAFGRVNLVLNKPGPARTALEKADSLRPNHPEVLQAMLQLDRDDGRLKESTDRIAKAVSAEPQNAQLVHLQGIAFALAGKPSDAEMNFRRAIELDPKDLAAYQSLAALLAASGRVDDMIKTYEKALETQPNSAPVNLTLGSLYESQGKMDKAIEFYEKAIKIDPNLAAAKNNLAYILAESGQNLDRALDLAQEAKASLPDNPNAADTLGWVLYRKGVPGAAIGYLKDAETSTKPGEPNLGLIRHHLALAYEANNEPERAKEALERALADLEAIKKRVEERGAQAKDPSWAADVRAMLERLKQGTPAPAGAPAGAPAAPAQG